MLGGQGRQDGAAQVGQGIVVVAVQRVQAQRLRQWRERGEVRGDWTQWEETLDERLRDMDVRILQQGYVQDNGMVI